MPPVDKPGGGKTGTIMRAIARLKPGVTTAQAAAEGTARAIAAPDAGPVAMSLFGAREPIQITVPDAKEAAAADVRPALDHPADRIGAAVRDRDCQRRQHAAGAGHRSSSRADDSRRARRRPGRLARQLLIENAIVGVLGSATGLALTMALHARCRRCCRPDSRASMRSRSTARVLAFTLLLSAITTMACGVLPLLHVRRLEIARALSDGSAGSAGAGRGRVARRARV